MDKETGEETENQRKEKETSREKLRLRERKYRFQSENERMKKERETALSFERLERKLNKHDPGAMPDCTEIFTD